MNRNQYQPFRYTSCGYAGGAERDCVKALPDPCGLQPDSDEGEADHYFKSAENIHILQDRGNKKISVISRRFRDLHHGIFLRLLVKYYQ